MVGFCGYSATALKVPHPHAGPEVGSLSMSLNLADLAPWLVTSRNTADSTKSHLFSFDDGFHDRGYASSLWAQVRCSFHGQGDP